MVPFFEKGIQHLSDLSVTYLQGTFHSVILYVCLRMFAIDVAAVVAADLLPETLVDLHPASAKMLTDAVLVAVIAGDYHKEGTGVLCLGDSAIAALAAGFANATAVAMEAIAVAANATAAAETAFGRLKMVGA